MSRFIRTPPPFAQRIDAPDGSIRLTTRLPLGTVHPSLPHLFDAVAARASDQPFLRQRDAAGAWRSITYGEAKQASDALGQWLIEQGIGIGDSVCYLSAPSIEHGIAAIGVQRSGAAIAPISVAYSLMSDNFDRLRSCVATIEAKVVIVDDAAIFAPALCALADLDPVFVAVRGKAEGIATIAWRDVLATRPDDRLAQRMAALTLRTTARIMYTSGSTGSPKATPQPHANLTVTVAQNEALGLLDFGGEAPQFLESMPFSHIMAGNFNFNNVIAAGGTMWIDDGKPTPALFARTIANLREVSPHFFISVPLAFAMLCDAMEADIGLRDAFFARLRFIGFGGALLPESVRARLLALSRAACDGGEIPIFSYYGATEFMFGALRYWPEGPSDVIGLPPPTTEMKLLPLDDDRLELRVRGRTMMQPSGYIGQPEASKRLFDAEGFYCTGDAVRFADPQDASRGLVFAGRLSEDFKLSSGTFVNATQLRQELLAHLGGLAQEVVLCGLNADYVSALIWLHPERVGVDIDTVLAAAIDAFNQARWGSSRRIGAVRIMDRPLAFDHGERTDKGNVAARVVRERRSADIAAIYAGEIDGAILRF